MAVGIALLAVPKATPFIGDLPAWLGLTILGFGVLLIALSTGTRIYEAIGAPHVYLRSPFYRLGAVETKRPPLAQTAPSKTKPLPLPTIASAATATTALQAPPASLEKRIFIDRTPEQLCAELQGVTGVKGQARIALYLGKWLRVTGPLGNVHKISDTERMVTFADRDIFHYNVVWAGVRDRESVERLDVKDAGDPITIVGRIDRVDIQNVHLESSELELGPIPVT